MRHRHAHPGAHRGPRTRPAPERSRGILPSAFGLVIVAVVGGAVALVALVALGLVPAGDQVIVSAPFRW